MNQLNPPPLQEGDRFRLTKMGKDPCPIPAGATGTVRSCNWIIDRWQVCVTWDGIQRSLNLVMPPDEVEIIR
jgi:hypothetical protein